MYKTNLLPRNLQPQAAIDQRRLVRMLAWTLLGCIIAGSYVFLIIDFQLKQQMIFALRQEVSTSEVTAQKVVQIKKERQQNEDSINKFRQLINSNINWYALLDDVNYCVPNGVWFTGITLSTSKVENNELQQSVLVFNGNSTDLSSIGVFIYKLQQLTYFSRVTLDYAKELDPKTEPHLLTFKISVTFPEGEKIE